MSAPVRSYAISKVVVPGSTVIRSNESRNNKYQFYDQFYDEKTGSGNHNLQKKPTIIINYKNKRKRNKTKPHSSVLFNFICLYLGLTIPYVSSI
jgi:hypothetical protein